MLFWRNANTNIVLYWKLDAACELANDTENDGWGAVSNTSVTQNWNFSGSLPLN